MNILIIEDEQPNALHIKKIVATVNPILKIAGSVNSVKGALQFLKNNKNIDLLFLDIQLSDGLGFEVLDRINNEIPVIIMTAYDHYALTAFQYLSVDYLLKPIKEEDLKRSLDKFFNNFRPTPAFSFERLANFLQPTVPTTIIGRRGKNRYPIKSNTIAYCFTEERETWILTIDGKEYLVPSNLDQLENKLNNNTFFRTNRKTICAKNAVEKFEILPKSRIKLMLNPTPTFDIIISSEKSAAFKDWICRA